MTPTNLEDELFADDELSKEEQEYEKLEKDLERLIGIYDERIKKSEEKLKQMQDKREENSYRQKPSSPSNNNKAEYISFGEELNENYDRKKINFASRTKTSLRRINVYVSILELEDYLSTQYEDLVDQDPNLNNLGKTINEMNKVLQLEGIQRNLFFCLMKNDMRVNPQKDSLNEETVETYTKYCKVFPKNIGYNIQNNPFK